MSTLYRLKAYFGMVPPEDMDAYADAYGYGDEYEPYEGRYQDRQDERYGRGDHEDPRAARSSSASEPVPDQRQAHDGGPSRSRRDSRAEPAWAGSGSAGLSGAAGLSGSAGGAGRSGHRTPPVHGSLAVDPDSSPMSSPLSLEPVSSASGTSSSAGSPALSRITTVHPRSYNEARTIGERYREGTPVIINLTELDDAAAKRLVDFAAGLAFALRGSIDKVTSRVFLLSPAGVDVSAEERRRLAESGFFGQG